MGGCEAWAGVIVAPRRAHGCRLACRCPPPRPCDRKQRPAAGACTACQHNIRESSSRRYRIRNEIRRGVPVLPAIPCGGWVLGGVTRGPAPAGGRPSGVGAGGPAGAATGGPPPAGAPRGALLGSPPRRPLVSYHLVPPSPGPYPTCAAPWPTPQSPPYRSLRFVLIIYKCL